MVSSLRMLLEEGTFAVSHETSVENNLVLNQIQQTELKLGTDEKQSWFHISRKTLSRKLESNTAVVTQQIRQPFSVPNGAN